MTQKKKTSFRMPYRYDLIIHLCTLILAVFGLFMVASATMGLASGNVMTLMKTIIKQLAFTVLGYLGMALLGIFDLTFVTTFCVVILMILPISAFSYDEFARWDRYAHTLPLSPRQIVGGRYLFVLLLLLVVAAIGAVSAVLWESLSAQLASLGVALFIVDVMLPLNYQLGPERARPFLFAVTFLPFILLFLLAKVNILDLSFLNRLQPSQAAVGFILFPLIALAGLALSFLISCRVTERKEY